MSILSACQTPRQQDGSLTHCFSLVAQQVSQTGGAKAALAAAVLAAAMTFGAPEPLMLPAHADEDAAATAFEKKQAAVERRKEIMIKACAPRRDRQIM